MNREELNKLFDEHFIDECNEVYDSRNEIVEFAEKAVKTFVIHGVAKQNEQLVSFLRQYQKACEIMHVHKIDAKSFTEQYKTN